VSQFYDGETAQLAAAEFDKVFARGQQPDEIPEVQRVSTAAISTSQLVFQCYLSLSGSEAKRMIRQSAVSINGRKVADPNEQIIPTDGMVVQVGKRKFAKIRIIKGEPSIGGL